MASRPHTHAFPATASVSDNSLLLSGSRMADPLAVCSGCVEGCEDGEEDGCDVGLLLGCPLGCALGLDEG